MEKRVLIGRWLEGDGQALPIYDEASVSAARQRVRENGRQLRLDTETIERAALIASELTRNQLIHAKQGYFAVRAVERHGMRGLETVAADLGPGIARPSLAISGRAATNGTNIGAGLSAVCSNADEVEFDNRITEGLRVAARTFDKTAPSLCCDIAIMSRPFPGEVISGDDAIFLQSESGFLAGVADGLGHGPEARQAADRAINTLRREHTSGLESLLHHINNELAGTRGCAMNIVQFDRRAGTLWSVSLGDVHSHVYNLRDCRSLPSTPFILGTGQLLSRRIRVDKTDIEAGSVLIMFTDGLKSRTTLKGQLEVLRMPPISIAEHLLENHARSDDDALVLVARFLR